MKQLLMMSALATILILPAGFTLAADQDQTRQQDQIYGSQLMTQQERLEHRNKMQAAKTAEERERIRKEHHERMKERAKERGMNLPDEPPAMNRRMMQPGSMSPGGMGPGGGMGGGRP